MTPQQTLKALDLLLLYDEMGREAEAQKVREEFEARLEAGETVCEEEFEEGDGEADAFPERGLVQLKTRFNFGPAGLPLDRLDDVRREAESRHEQLLGGHARKVGRNERCPCGSGKKYKRCCGR
jgi:preprotein translocase subunit SecA